MTVLGGYLGAGKTTLLNDLLGGALGDDLGDRVVVVVNDFGTVNVDAELVGSRSADTLELSNGCVCCSLVDGMAAVIDRIRAMTPAPDHVVVEVSGVGDPATVAGWGDHPGFRRNGVVVCADVMAVREHAAERWVADTVRQQFAGADVVLLTKTDLAETDLVEDVRGWLSRTAPQARVVEDRVRLAALLARGVVGAGRSRDHDDRHDHGGHEERHTAWTLPCAAPVPRAGLEERLAALSGVVRVKGVLDIVAADGSVTRTVVNVAGDRVRTTELEASESAREHADDLVVIVTGPEAPEPPSVTDLRLLLDPAVPDG